MRKFSFLILIALSLSACKKDAQPSPADPDQSMYFPDVQGSSWETVSTSSLSWRQTAIDSLKKFLNDKHSKSFMILVNGRIVMEEYFNGHNSTASWEWNSAGKTLVSATTGIAQEEGFVNIDSKASDYLGLGWTNMPVEKENLIKVKDLLRMTSGIDDTKQLVIRPNLTYVADAGSRWAYGNVFQKLTDVVAAGTKMPFETFFNDKLKNKIGMDGFWNFGAIYTIYHSSTRSMARFGLLALNNGKWNDQQILPVNFFNASISTSQAINPSYGYLWWLNGKEKFMIPGSQIVFPGSLIPNAPADMYAAMGANDQRIYVVPGKKMVIVRMGDASDPANPSFAVSGFDQSLWTMINAVIN